ncbi:MAG: hypothetical protein SP1CHLAM54_01540 [Chlamydiia bacterium]|nr:hypothetical protein [Chlamydiia bacterium]MCH9615073.1 hypothetical protein [Chlamydiia bacterium]MCH9628605.1 hypothetical protein [Chlamydiia bacterium]
MRYILFLLLIGCSDLKTVKEDEIKRKNATFEPIVRRQEDVCFPIFIPLLKQRNVYPWEEKSAHLEPLTINDMRCKGDKDHPSRILPVSAFELTELADCHPHSLPKSEGVEVYSKTILDLLNLIQRELKKPVRITSGHRCPIHNLYNDPTGSAVFNKHLVAGEVDFIVEGATKEEVFALIKQNVRGPVTSLPEREEWAFDDVIVRWKGTVDIYDFDNRHNTPYFTLEDRHLPLTWDLAFSIQH